MLIDTHCHLTDRRFSDIGGVLKRAQEAGMERVIVPSTSVEDAKLAVEISEKYQQYCLVGIHPENVEEIDFLLTDQYQDLMNSVSIGSFQQLHNRS